MPSVQSIHRLNLFFEAGDNLVELFARHGDHLRAMLGGLGHDAVLELVRAFVGFARAPITKRTRVNIRFVGVEDHAEGLTCGARLWGGRDCLLRMAALALLARYFPKRRSFLTLVSLQYYNIASDRDRCWVSLNVCEGCAP